MPKLIEAMASWTPQVTVPDYRDPMASSTIEGLAQILLNNTAWLREFIETEVQARVQHAEATSSVHGATAAAQAGRLVARDASGRAQVSAPSNPADIARLDTVTAAVSGRAPASHTHAIGDVAGLQAALNSKSGSSHSHAISDVAGLQTALDGKAASSHSHAISGVTGLQAALNGKAASSHTHAISNVTGLQSALNGKAASSHSHAITDITGLEAALKPVGATNDGHVAPGQAMTGSGDAQHPVGSIRMVIRLDGSAVTGGSTVSGSLLRIAHSYLTVVDVEGQRGWLRWYTASPADPLPGTWQALNGGSNFTPHNAFRAPILAVRVS